MSYFTATGNTTLIATRGYGPTPTGLGGILDSIGSFIKNGAGTALSIYNSGQQAQGASAVLQQQVAAQQQAARTPGWVLPVVAGGAVLGVAAILMSRKRRNPARRRRSR